MCRWLQFSAYFCRQPIILCSGEAFQSNCLLYYSNPYCIISSMTPISSRGQQEFICCQAIARRSSQRTRYVLANETVSALPANEMYPRIHARM
jgi:hypothetical protein